MIPGDIALQEISAAASARPAIAIDAPRVTPDQRNLAGLGKLLNAGKRITLLCGRGCAGAHEQLIRLGETLKSPIVHALGGKEHVEWTTHLTSA